METKEKKVISVKTIINAPIEKVWKNWTRPKDIVKWNHASEDWHTTHAENDLRVGGKFLARMEAKDDSFGFDFSGVYDDVQIKERIAYTLDDGRKVEIIFTVNTNGTNVEEIFEAESTNPIELQRNGWQAILVNFKKYVETRN